MSSVRRERDRIRAEYRRRDADTAIRARYKPDHPTVERESAALDAALLQLFGDHRLLPLSSYRVLEVGCGAGGQLARLVRLGASAARVHGIDLSRDRLEKAREALPEASLLEADAAELPFRDGAFDIVVQLTVLSSIIDGDVRVLAAREMTRVLARGGAIVSYDMRTVAPGSSVIPISAGELHRLFPDAQTDVRSLTLAPPLARLLDPTVPRLAALLAGLPWLRTHQLALVRPRSAPTPPA
jgi:SAM-dependent methyltransferase